ncbi:hypothetical protein M427DRAFT_400291 [Gonapodya prolifera JEL478]|uniref:Rab3 GTPase-activating protein catalytic subunit n=1 Tax=Gonapodya prolifera (strain JEL478) TaxID=1344416 RepID=A0A139ATH7_GONPJ|nr:hypothetical protein M427DRAFT_400291 [Gonapodya prolifera JEL478]|eukprot:KXS20019.1 hypothetical protein M427DRAFT_400291 [Gonapodya prolifera JEL478]
MSAFKAANPGAVLADFVRWHSPRDWTEGEAGDFELSARMRDSGNLWAETWQQAKRVAAAKQEPLFDYEREAVKALQYLKSITVFELLLQLLPTSFLIVYDHLFTSTSSDITPVRSAHSFFANSLADFPWRSLPCAPGDTELTETASDLLDRLVEESRHAERMVARAASLERVIGPGMPSLIEAALTKEHGEGVRVHDGNERDAVWRMMIDSELRRNAFGLWKRYSTTL